MTLSTAATLAAEDLARHAGELLLAVDFDGTLAPIVDDPEHAHANPASMAALRSLCTRIRQVAIITGRPVATALRLAGIEAADYPGLVILGQYGVERWDADTGELRAPPPAVGITAARDDLNALVAARDDGLRLEDKGRALAIHSRRAADPARSLAAVREEVEAIAARHALALEPGRHVLELRSGHLDKGAALRSLVAQTGAGAVAFIGDDLGDLPAFEAVERMRQQGMIGLRLCSASDEQPAVAAATDIELSGTAGVAAWLGALVAAIGTS